MGLCIKTTEYKMYGAFNLTTIYMWVRMRTRKEITAGLHSGLMFCLSTSGHFYCHFLSWPDRIAAERIGDDGGQFLGLYLGSFKANGDLLGPGKALQSEFAVGPSESTTGQRQAKD